MTHLSHNSFSSRFRFGASIVERTQRDKNGTKSRRRREQESTSLSFATEGVCNGGEEEVWGVRLLSTTDAFASLFPFPHVSTRSHTHTHTRRLYIPISCSARLQQIRSVNAARRHEVASAERERASERGTEREKENGRDEMHPVGIGNLVLFCWIFEIRFSWTIWLNNFNLPITSG